MIGVTAQSARRNAAAIFSPPPKPPEVPKRMSLAVGDRHFVGRVPLALHGRRAKPKRYVLGDEIVFSIKQHRLSVIRGLACVLCMAIVSPGICRGLADEATESRWYGSVDALWLQLDHGSNGNTPVILNSTTGESLLGTYDLTYPMAAGPRLSLGRRLGDGAAVELLYFGLNYWDSSRTVVGDNDLRIPGDLGLATFDFFNADQLSVSQNATIDNVEVNFWAPTGSSPFGLAAGFRYLNLDERFQISGLDSDTGASRYAIATRNDLFGAQLAARYRRMQLAGGRLGLESYAKAGIFGNSVGMNQLVTDFENTFVARNTAVSAGRAAFVGDIGLTGLVRVTDSINIRLGYSLIWVEGVARAANQLDFTDTATSGTAFNYGQGAFMQGVTAGFEFGW